MAFGAILRAGKGAGLDEVVAYDLGIARCRYISLAKTEVVGLANFVRVVFSRIVRVRLRLGSVGAGTLVVRRLRLSLKLRNRVVARGVVVRLGLRCTGQGEKATAREDSCGRNLMRESKSH